MKKKKRDGIKSFHGIQVYDDTFSFENTTQF